MHLKIQILSLFDRLYYEDFWQLVYGIWIYMKKIVYLYELVN